MFCKKCGDSFSGDIKFCGKCGTPTVESAPATHAGQLMLPASILRRLSNHLIDNVVIQIISGVFFASGVYSESVLMSIVGSFIYLIGYYVICESVWGRTVGKLVTGTKVVDKDGNKPSLLRILGRSFARWIPFEALSFLTSGFPIGWHDSLSKTYVVSSAYSVEDVKRINPEEVKKATVNSAAVTIITIVVAVLIIIPIIGITSSVILASLNSARTQGGDTQVKSSLAIVKTNSLVYANESKVYSGFCSNLETIEELKFASKAGGSSEYDYVCNDDNGDWAVSVPLKSGGYWCVDGSKDEAVKLDSALSEQTSCSSVQGIDGVREDLKAEFVNSCSDGELVLNDYCSCAYDRLVEKFGIGGLIEMSLAYEKTGVFDQRFTDTIRGCQNLIK